MIVLKIVIEIPLSDDYLYLKQLADICLAHNELKYLKIYLDKCLNIAKECETLRELIKISNNFDEAEEYLKIAYDLYTENTDIDEIDWIIAVCWNNGTRSIGTFQYTNSRNWMQYALKFSEKFKHTLVERMRNIYNELNEYDVK